MELKVAEGKVKTLTPTYQCMRCGKVFAPNHMVVMVMHIERIAIDPETKVAGCQASSDFELAHFDCQNPTGNYSGSVILSS